MDNAGTAGTALLLAGLCLLAPGLSFAADPPAAPRVNLLKRTLRSFVSDDLEGDGRGMHLGPLFPRVETLSSGGGLAPMLHFWLPDVGGTPLDVHASAAYSTYNYQYYDVQLGLVPHQGKALPRVAWGTSAPFPLSDLEKTAVVPGFGVYASARYRDYPRETFYGVGDASSRLDRSGYRLQDGLYDGIARFRVAPVAFMFRAGLLRTSILPGRDTAFPDTAIVHDDTTAPGLVRAPDFWHFSAGAWLELRDEPGNPHRGASIGVAFSRFNERMGEAFDFNRTVVDVREYVSLGSPRHVLALRQVTSIEQPDAGSRVPFYMQSSLGGSNYLPGYSSARFRDLKLLALAAEYRFELVPKLELALIHQMGKVFSTMGEFDLHDMRRSWGVGIRLKSWREVRMRVDLMHSSEGTRVDLKAGQSF